MNSEVKKPGPTGVLVADLIFWEHEWYWIFNGLVLGVPERTTSNSYWAAVPPPKRTGSEDLNRQRVKEWNALRKTPGGWKHLRYSTHRRGIPPERALWERIKLARYPAAIVKICDESLFWLNPESNARPYVVRLKENAAEFLRAKEYRYPRSDRPSSEHKRVVHFACAMAGIMEGIGAVRAIDLIRLLDHGAKCACVRCEIETQKG